MEPLIGADAVLVSAAKGLDPRTGRPLSGLLARSCPAARWPCCPGPRSRGMSRSASRRRWWSRRRTRWWRARCSTHLAAPAFRLYTNRDVLGVELGGALKNIVAIATGLCDGLALGENARAALITRGLAEIVRLGAALGAQPATFSGLAGLGDLVLTCTGSLSRNRALGREIAHGRSLADAEAATRMIAEGVRTTVSAMRLAREARVPMPICAEVRSVLFEGKPVAEALHALLARDPRPEEEVSAVA